MEQRTRRAPISIRGANKANREIKGRRRKTSNKIQDKIHRIQEQGEILKFKDQAIWI